MILSRLSKGRSFTQRSSTQSYWPLPWPYRHCLSDLQGQAGTEADGQGSEISPHAVISCDWPCFCAAGWWQSVLSEQSVRGLLFDFGCTGPWQEQLGRCTGFPLFMWGPGINVPAHCCAGVLHQLPLTVQSSLWKDTVKERARGRWEGFLPTILKDCPDTVLWKVSVLLTYKADSFGVWI